MKRLHLLLAALGLVFFISSCKNTMDVTKRRYTKGYHFEKHTAPSTPQESVAGQKPAGKIHHLEPVAASLPAEKTVLPELKGGIQEHTPVAGFGKKETGEHAMAHTQKEEKSIPAGKAADHKAWKQGSHVQQKDSGSTSGGGDSDVKMILLIILAIFIPPLAMYLWDKQTDVWFIVDLILFLLLFTWFFLGPLGLAGLAAIVIAILRILGAL